MKAETNPAPAANSGAMGAVGPKHPLLVGALLLAAILGLLFWKNFVPNQTVFANDDPLGQMVAEQNLMPSILTGLWQDLNWFGNESLTPAPTISTALRLVTSPVGFMKIFYPAALFIVGICACFCFRQFKLAPLACVLGGLAAGLNSDFFSTASWGVATQVMGIGADYLALGFLAGAVATRRRWIKVILAGLAVGVGVMEAYDIGALFSLFIAAFVLYQAVFIEGEGVSGPKVARGVVRLALIGGFAVLIASHTLSTLIGTQIKGVAGTEQDAATKQRRWGEATQWSLPKAEIFQTLVPGVFGYRMDWQLYDAEQPGADKYWGRVGEAPPGYWRFSGTGLYAGVPVVLIALWGIFQSFRSKGSPFSRQQRRAIWFWAGVLVVTALFAFGKYAPFYQFFYALPYASTIRNPFKFMHIFSWALVIVFAYGMHGLTVAYMQNPVARVGGVIAQFKSWRARATPFERLWLNGSFISIGVALLGWLIYASSKSDLAGYMRTIGIGPEADDVARFSIMAVGWFVLLLAVTVVLLALICSGQFAGPRARWGGLLLGALLVFDLGRADTYWPAYWDTSYKYVSNPILDYLRDKPYEHRVQLLPIDPGNNPQMRLLSLTCTLDWKQALFPYYNIQCGDVVQEPRVANDKTKFLTSVDSFRAWQLCNVRYFLGPGGGSVDHINQQIDPTTPTFRIAKFNNGQLASFEFEPRTQQPTQWPVDYVPKPKPDGQLAVLEYIRALPRAKLYSTWQINSNDDETLHMLNSPTFDPAQSVLVADAIPAPAAADAGKPPGTVEIKPNYKSKYIELDADVKTPSVLLLSERYDPKWRATVDGKPENILRCNFIERGILLQPGKHNIVMRYSSPMTTFYASLAFVVLGLILSGYLAVTKDEEMAATALPKPVTPVKAVSAKS